MKSEDKIKVGKADTNPSVAAHTQGVRAGNDVGNLEKEPGFVQDGDILKGTSRRSTGIGAEQRNPIDPRMPNISPQ